MMPQDVNPAPNQSDDKPPVVDVNPFPTTDETETKVGGPQDAKRENWRSIVSTIVILIAAPLVALLLINFVFQSYEVDGPSMETTLQNHDRLIVDKIPRTIARIKGRDYIPNRGDIVIFTEKGLADYGIGDKQLIKRVIGVPGDRVVVADGHITVYNTEHPNGYNPDLNPHYGSVIHDTSAPAPIDVTVKSGEVFVCGDNRENSLDSRTFGAVSAKNIVGRLTFRIYPLSKAQSF